MSAEPHTPARARAQLTATGLTVRRGGRTILDGLDLVVAPRARIAVVGENGRGKTTLLHALAGRLVPEEGTVRTIGTVGLAEQELETDGRRIGDLLDEALAGARAALAALDGATAALESGAAGAIDSYTRALETCEAVDAWDAERHLGIALDALSAVTERARSLESLSVGQRYRVRLACLLGAEPDFLLLDEPTNHLDAAGRAFLTDRIRASRGGEVVVSHDRALLHDVGERFIDLDPSQDGGPRVYGGGYDGWRAGRAADRSRWEQTYADQQAEHRRLEASLDDAQQRLSTGWRPDKGTGRHQRQSRAPGVVQAVNRQRAALAAHAVTVPEPPLQFRMPTMGRRTGATPIRATDAMVTGRLAGPVTLRVEAGDRLLITGPNGAGKSTVLGLLAGTLAPDGGEVRRARGIRVALVGQESSRFGRHGTAAQVYDAHVGHLVAAGRIAESEAVELGALGLLDPGARRTPVTRLSKGQQRRLELAMRFAERPDVLLLDEPTNHLSIPLVDELVAALQETRAAVVLAGHDRQLLRDLDEWPQLALSSPSESRPVVGVGP